MPVLCTDGRKCIYSFHEMQEKNQLSLQTFMPKESKDILLALIREKKPMNFSQQLNLTAKLSVPAILAQFTTVMMQFIDASMVGYLGSKQAASIGLVSTCTWLFGGFCVAASAGFSVQVAHLIGANDFKSARSVLRQSWTFIGSFSVILALIGISISGVLPGWLGGSMDIRHDSTSYFLIYSAFIPFMMFTFSGSSMLQCSGNMKISSLLSVAMCVLDVIFNYFLIFPTRPVSIAGMSLTMPGAGLGVSGAALGTGFAMAITAGFAIYYLLFRSKELKLISEKGSFSPTRVCIKNALGISLPMAMQNLVMRGAYIVTTIIIAPLGTVAIAANMFGIMAESFCYMPGSGISDASTSLVGQSLGAGRKDLAKGFANIAMGTGMTVMTILSMIMFITAPQLMGIMSQDPQVIALGAKVLRIEAFAETLYAASLVGYGIFVGASDTLVPSIMNLTSIWVVRVILALILTPKLGLTGCWIAMCVELNVRGALFLVRLKSGKWMKYVKGETKEVPTQQY